MREEIKRLSALTKGEKSSESQKNKREKNNDDKQHASSSETKSAKPGKESDVVKISAIDELMDNTDWFVAPEPTPLKKSAEVEEDFGYREPAQSKKVPRDDDKQLSLW